MSYTENVQQWQKHNSFKPITVEKAAALKRITLKTHQRQKCINTENEREPVMYV